MKVAVVGSTTYPVVTQGPALVEWLAQFPRGTVVYTRGSKGFDEFVNAVCDAIDIENIKMPGKGGAENFLRDIDLVEQVDEVHAFFADDQVGQGGTQHVVDKALDAGRPVHSYAAYGKRFVLIGSSEDGEHPQGGGGEKPRSEATPVGEAAKQRTRTSPEIRSGRRDDLPF